MIDSEKEPIQEEAIDIRDLLRKFAGYWHWFLISLIICISIAFFKNYSAVPIYEVGTSVLVKEEKSMLDDRFSSMPSIDNSSFQVSNQIGILKSFSLAKRTIQSLNFRISYFQRSKFNYRELYKVSPFLVVLDTSSAVPVNVPIYIEIKSPTSYTASADGENLALYNFTLKKITGKISGFDATGSLFRTFRHQKLNFTIVPNNNTDLKNYTGCKFYFIVSDDISLARKFRQINVQDNKSSSILTISIQGYNTSKLADYLNSLTQIYLDKGLEKKNQVAENTIRFIDSQLGDVADSLFFSEKTLQDYRSEHNVMDVNFQVQQVFTSIENLKNQRAELVVKNKYYDYLKQFMIENKEAKDLIAPSSLGIQDMVLNNMINELINLYGERAELILNSKKDNPYLSSNERRIADIRQSVLKNIDNLAYASRISLQDIDKRINEIEKKGNTLPETQRKLIGFERKFKLNDALYTYLLTKRSETQIAKASYLPDNEVLDQASAEEYRIVYPNTRRDYIIAILLGLGLPAIFLLLREYFNNRIQNDDDIEAMTDYPILGHIVRSKETSRAVVVDYPMSLTAESVRAIRTNFQFISNETEKNIILLTSSIKGEGKSFTTLNLALSLGTGDKKLVLINFDLRRPKLHEYLGVESEKGLSVYLSGNASLDEIIQTSPYRNIHAIMSGVIPPNPMELIANERTKIMFEELKRRYDYILVDTPPIGMVADALLLLKYSDINIFIVRQNYTYKKVFYQLINTLRKRNIQNVNIILNDIRLDSPYRAHQYGYAYNYGYGYIDENTSIWKRRKLRKKKVEMQKGT